jgi:serine/threonine protein kinase/tetratricopeptide (TPR) repeat protein
VVGTTISHYRILEKLGEGGMGEVYLAEDTSLDRRVALKSLPSSLADDEIAHKRFLREARSAAALDHPYICTIHEVTQTEDGQNFIVMEHIRGVTLQEKLTEGPLFLKDALKIASEIAEALEQAHEKGIVHRDLKPANIMLTPEGHAKVMDFGIAKRVPREDGTEQDVSTRLTTEESTVGTLAYMSPEQLRGGRVDTRSDIFSFGVLIYEMLTGVHPFRRPQAVDTTSAILKEDPPALTRYQEDLSEVLQHMVRRMLAKSPDERYQSVREVRTDLVEELNLLSSLETIPYTKQTSSRTSPFTVGFAVLGLAIVAVLIYWNWGFLTEPPGSPETARNSIAVLPFDNLSPNPEEVYFSDGITEDITTELSRISGLKVIARTSSFRFRDSDKTIPQIAKELGVETILEGSVRKSEDKVRIVAQLIDANTEEHLWAQRYDRDMEDVFAVQGEVAEQIADALRVELTADVRESIEKGPTENVQAYDLFLMGRHFREIETAESLKIAADYYEQAIREDPTYAQAYAWLADAYFLMNYYLPGEWMENAEEAARKALELDQTIAAAHVTMSNLQGYHHGDLISAEMGYRKALELDPGYVNAHREYGLFLLRLLGRLNDASVQLKLALELDPLSHLTNVNMAECCLARSELVPAMDLGRKILKLYPDSRLSYLRIGQVYHWMAEYEKAEVWLKRAYEIDPNWWETRITLAETYLCQGQFNRAREIIQTGPSLSRSPGKHAAGTVALWAGDYARARTCYEEDKLNWYIRTKVTSWDTYAPLMLGYIRWKTGDRTGAEKLLSQSLVHFEELLNAGNEWYEVPEGIAKVHAIRGNTENAYLWLQKAIDAGWRWYDLAAKDPVWENLHDEPRFQQMMTEVKAEVDEMRQRVEEMEEEWEQ